MIGSVKSSYVTFILNNTRQKFNSFVRPSRVDHRYGRCSEE